ncbi:MAG: DUF5107 domain-containing protein [Verrucomicrobia bacterium]|nr:DUF5107 domain-containing protein [Verrucomicrobiota bacterium]
MRANCGVWGCAVWLLAAVTAAGAGAVEVREGTIVLPTYLVGEPERNPMFFFGRASQGAEGRVYPYPLHDTLTHRKEDKAYRIVYLENEHVRLGILPEIGGRLFEGVDKSNGYDFVYRQHVIKPALIGLTGAWISGGMEWNVPHHHRATTFVPVQCRVDHNPDGSKTVWVGELELRHRMRWAVGYTLHPGKSHLETRLRVVNRTPFVHTLLCFANVAVHVNEDYQVIFPPRTQYVTHHHKREFTTWPVATGRYGGYDFGNGTDVSWFTNHIAANSMFAWNCQGDFLAGYDHRRGAGLLSVADHHVVPGKKLWTWGNGPRGRMWDRILTDADGPYLELMVGAYSDNQPDYSWVQPFEVKSFEIFWYPFRGIGGVKNATPDAAVNLDVTHGTARVGFCTTSARREARVRLQAGGRTLLDETAAIDPGRPFLRQVALPAGVDPRDLRASLAADGRELVAYAPVQPAAEPMPEAVKPPLPPGQLKTNEELYLTGLWIEQFHNAALEPDPYWEEALRRDPDDVRVNTAFGVTCLKRARHADAERHLRRALGRLTARHASPKNGEPRYYLGLALRAQGKSEEAFDHFYQAAWSAAWRAPAYFALAEIACARGEHARALEFVARSLEANASNVRALTLNAALLRRLGRPEDARSPLAAAVRTDPLDVRVLAERWLLSRSAPDAQALVATLHAHPATALETAAELDGAGLWQDGADVLDLAAATAPDTTRVSPLLHYYLAHFHARLGNAAAAAAHGRRAREASPDCVFPFQAEFLAVLRRAMDAHPADARAPYYLGNLLFDWQPDAAVALWEQSAALDPSFPVVHRNLAVAYSRQATGNALDKAIASLEKAVALPRPHPLHFAELDELYEAAGTPPDKRLALLERHAETVARRDNAQARLIALKIVAGKCDDAIGLMTGRRFAVWEGASLSVADHWTDAHVMRGHQRLTAGRPQAALADYQAASRIPENLPSERRGSGSRAAETAYWTGIAHEHLGQADAARTCWQEAAGEQSGSARRGGDRVVSDRSVQAFYQARALEKLGEAERARRIFERLVDTAAESLKENRAPIDYFASFGKQRSQRSQWALAHYVAGLGHWGLGRTREARNAFARTLEITPDHIGARDHLSRLP